MIARSETTPFGQEGRAPLFGGALWRGARRTHRLLLPLAGRRWNPIFAVVEHRGRKSGRLYRAPVAARRVDGGFVISVAFGAQVDWHKNLVAARGGAIRWKGTEYPVGAPRHIGLEEGISTFNPVQRFFLRIGRVNGYIRVDDVKANAEANAG